MPSRPCAALSPGFIPPAMVFICMIGTFIMSRRALTFIYYCTFFANIAIRHGVVKKL